MNSNFIPGSKMEKKKRWYTHFIWDFEVPKNLDWMTPLKDYTCVRSRRDVSVHEVGVEMGEGDTRKVWICDHLVLEGNGVFRCRKNNQQCNNNRVSMSSRQLSKDN